MALTRPASVVRAAVGRPFLRLQWSSLPPLITRPSFSSSSSLLTFTCIVSYHTCCFACLGISTAQHVHRAAWHRQWIESEDIVFGLMQNWSGWEVQKLRPDEGNSSGLNSSNSSFGWTDGRPDGAGDPSAETIMNWDPLWLPEGTVSRRQKGLLCQLMLLIHSARRPCVSCCRCAPHPLSVLPHRNSFIHSLTELQTPVN